MAIEQGPQFENVRAVFNSSKNLPEATGIFNRRKDYKGESFTAESAPTHEVEVLAHIPGEKGGAWTRINGGLMHTNWSNDHLNMDKNGQLSWDFSEPPEVTEWWSTNNQRHLAPAVLGAAVNKYKEIVGNRGNWTPVNTTDLNRNSWKIVSRLMGKGVTGLRSPKRRFEMDKNKFVESGIKDEIDETARQIISTHKTEDQMGMYPGTISPAELEEGSASVRRFIRGK